MKDIVKKDIIKNKIFSYYEESYYYECEELYELFDQQIKSIDKKNITNIVYDFLEKKLKDITVEDIGIDVNSEIIEVYKEDYYITVFKNIKEMKKIFEKDIFLFNHDFYIKCGFENENKLEYFDYVTKMFLANDKIKSAIEEAVRELLRKKFALETTIDCIVNTSYTSYVYKEPILKARIRISNLYNFILDNYYNTRELNNLTFSLIKQTILELGALDAKNILDNLFRSYNTYEIEYQNWFHFTCVINEIPCDLEEIRNLLEERYFTFTSVIKEVINLFSSYDIRSKKFYNDIFRKVLNDNGKMQILNEIYINSFIEEINKMPSRQIELTVKRVSPDVIKIIIKNKSYKDTFSKKLFRKSDKHRVTKMNKAYSINDNYCNECIKTSEKLFETKEIQDDIYSIMYDYFSNINLDAYELGIDLNSSISDIITKEYYYSVFKKPDTLEKLFEDVLPIFSRKFKERCIQKVFGSYEKYVNYYIKKFLNDNRIGDNIIKAFLDNFNRHDIHYTVKYVTNNYKKDNNKENEGIIYLVLYFTDIYGFLKDYFMENKQFILSVRELVFGTISFMAESSALFISNFDSVEMLYEDFIQFFTDIFTYEFEEIPEYSLEKVYEIVYRLFETPEYSVDLDYTEIYDLIEDKSFFIYLFKESIKNKYMHDRMNEHYIKKLIRKLSSIDNLKTKIFIYDKNNENIYKNK